MFLSFALLWAWLLSRIYSHQTAGVSMGSGWKTVQIVAAVALGWILVRRLRRVHHAIKEVGEQMGFAPRRKKN